MNTTSKTRVLGAVIALVVVPLAGTADADTLVYDNVRGWTIRTDLDQEFRCFAEAEYDSGTVIQAGFNTPDGSFYLSVADYMLASVDTGSAYVVQLSFDDEESASYDAGGFTLDGEFAMQGVRIAVDGAVEDQLLADLIWKRTFSLEVPGAEPLTLSLAGSKLALDSLDDCRVEMARALDSGQDTVASSDEL